MKEKIIKGGSLGIIMLILPVFSLQLFTAEVEFLPAKDLIKNLYRPQVAEEKQPQVIPVREYPIELEDDNQYSPPANKPTRPKKRQPQSTQPKRPGLFPDRGPFDRFNFPKTPNFKKRLDEMRQRFEKFSSPDYFSGFFREYDDLFRGFDHDSFFDFPEMDGFFKDSDSFFSDDSLFNRFTRKSRRLKIIEKENEIVVLFDLKGEKPDSVDISLQGRNLSLKMKQKKREERKNQYGQGKFHSYSLYSQARTLPAEVDPQFEKKVENGKLI
ncbi:Hsp20/alpha crystallin family protein, partial [Candidatus Riflebacteria bacterium]